MAGDQQQNTAATASQPAWTAGEYEAALAHLYKLQEQVQLAVSKISASFWLNLLSG